MFSWFKKPQPPRFDPECYTVGFATILSFLDQYIDITKMEPWRNQWYANPVNPAYVMRSIESYKYEYVDIKRECEAFCYIFKGKLSEFAYGHLLAMYVSLTLLNGDQHALIGFMQSNKLVLGEPQTGQIVDLKYKKINGIWF